MALAMAVAAYLDACAFVCTGGARVVVQDFTPLEPKQTKEDKKMATRQATQH